MKVSDKNNLSQSGQLFSVGMVNSWMGNALGLQKKTILNLLSS